MFQYDVGPPKHVFHLVWSVLGISTAIKTALKVALYDFFDGPVAPLNGQFMEKVNHYNRTKHKDFLMGPSVKFVLAIVDSVSQSNLDFENCSDIRTVMWFIIDSGLLKFLTKKGQTVVSNIAFCKLFLSI